MSWTVIQGAEENVHTIKFTYSGTLDQRVLLTADQHFDNPKCNRSLLFEHLEEAKELNTPICIIGDFFCLMQGKYDPRKSMEGLRPEHRKEDYLGAVIETTVKELAPYAHLIAVVGYGNHETNILKRQGVDMIKWLCRELRAVTGNDWPMPGGYRGFVDFSFRHDSGGRGENKVMWYTHGAGGGGPVTLGTIKSSRRAASTDGVDIVAAGHVHEYWNLKRPMFRLTRGRRVLHFMQRHIQLGTYKDEIGNGAAGWANENEFAPKPLGGYWLRFRHRNKKIRINVEEAD